MTEVSKERPQYPVEFIINYLRENNPEKNMPAGASVYGGSQQRSLASMMMKDPHTPKADIKLYNHLQKAPAQKNSW